MSRHKPESRLESITCMLEHRKTLEHVDTRSYCLTIETSGLLSWMALTVWPARLGSPPQEASSTSTSAALGYRESATRKSSRRRPRTATMW